MLAPVKFDISVTFLNAPVDDQILGTLVRLSQQMEKLMATLADVQAAVAAEDTVIDSAIALLKGLAQQIADLKPNQAAIDALAADVGAKTKALADAVVANTPVGPEPQ